MLCIMDTQGAADLVMYDTVSLRVRQNPTLGQGLSALPADVHVHLNSTQGVFNSL